jgi:aminoglycoside phosphotransferase family enzyme
MHIPTLEDKVAFVSDQCSCEPDGKLNIKETHLSWVFLTNNLVHKLNKPVRFPYLDYTTVGETSKSLPERAKA